jgi:hypothetical protein
MNVIDSKSVERDRQISLRNLRELDCVGKPVSTFPHPPLVCRRSGSRFASADTRSDAPEAALHSCFVANSHSDVASMPIYRIIAAGNCEPVPISPRSACSRPLSISAADSGWP